MDSRVMQNKELLSVMQQANISAIENPFINPIANAIDVFDLSSRARIPNLLQEVYKVKCP
ncbi:hypothetical protein [endosymbiont 'TC1' of Trimyema compressum]|uniref:hypothetical protein n=1 Tax=endosymbiont 'TC1' of Trimyema compressum TaxID=243899 RepID=UPI0013924137|nr:hypothetical protein [endosymbiont 'TC1' of Trimyema compressum]